MSEPAKVLFVHDSGNWGGAGKILEELVVGISHERFHPTVICGSDGELVERLRSSSIDVRVVRLFRPEPIHPNVGQRTPFRIPLLVPTVRNLRQSLICASRLKLAAMGMGARMVHGNGIVANIVAGLAFRGSGIPLVWHEHGIQPEGFRRTLYRRLAMHWPDCLVAVSEAVKCSFAPWPQAAPPIHVIYNGLRDPRQPIRNPGWLAAELGVDPDTRIVVMASMMRAWKGHHVFLDAVSMLPLEPPTLFVILGAGQTSEDRAYEGELKRRVGVQGGGRVRFLGHRRDVIEILAEADCLVSASLTPDPFPTVILEAMQAGTAVVATRTGGQIEMVCDGQTGFLVPPGSPVELAAALGRIVSDESYAKALGRRGRERAINQFGRRAFIDGFEKVYRTLLDRTDFR